jgi:hypothetical protein
VKHAELDELQFETGSENVTDNSKMVPEEMENVADESDNVADELANVTEKSENVIDEAQSQRMVLYLVFPTIRNGR